MRLGVKVRSNGQGLIRVKVRARAWDRWAKVKV